MIHRKIDMNISSYAAYFHDGSIIDIQYKGSVLLLSMESAEMSEEDLIETIALSEHNSLKGILHLEGIEAIFIDNEPFHGKLHMLADSGGILHLEIEGNKVRVFVDWDNYPPKKKIEKYSDIVIECKEIYWENVPDLYDPFG